MKTTIDITKQSEGHDAVLDLSIPGSEQNHISVHTTIREAWATAKQTIEAHGLSCPPMSEMDVESEPDGYEYVLWESSALYCDECGDDKLAPEEGELGWFRCNCGILHTV